MKTPLYNALIEYSKHKKPFHMPGHKLGTFGDMKQLDFTALDVTEANGLDNLYEAEGIIKEAMQEMSRFYGAKSTTFLTNGSTAGILASLMTICKPGDKVLIARNCHHSVWHALILIGAVPIYIQPEYSEDFCLMGVIAKETISQALDLYPEVKGAIIVSPTYEGIVSDVKGIAEVLHEQDKVLIVDEAHGAHFVVNEAFPESSVLQGADLVIQSMHKTLPTLTQSALLHRGTNKINEGELIKNLRLVQTSSPSYVMMSLMDYMRGYIESHRTEIKKSYIVPLEKMRKELSKMRKLKLLELPSAMYDQSKIVIFTNGSGIDGYTLGQYLEERYDIVAEAMLPHLIILMTTLADNEQTLTHLEKALRAIDDELFLNKSIESDDRYSELIGPILSQVDDVKKGELSPREVYYKEAQLSPIDRCLDRICAQQIMLYPPGVPIICLGERISKVHIDLIKQYRDRLNGLEIVDGQIHCKVL